jgi:hypothetical protein
MNHNNAEHGNTDRRTVLKTVSAGVGLPIVGSTEAIATQPTVQLVSVGITVKEEFPQSCVIPLPTHSIDDGDLVLIEPDDSLIDMIKSNDFVGYAHDANQKFQSIPTTMFNQQQRSVITTELNDGYQPNNVQSSVEEVPFPPVILNRGGKGAVSVRSGSNEMIIDSGNSDSMTLGSVDIALPPQSKSGKSRSKTATQEVRVWNSKPLSVKKKFIEDTSAPEPQDV